MPTQNRRVATYLPLEIDDRLKAFIAERNFKGDSPALIAILSEFFGVSQEVTHQSNSLVASLQSRIEALEEKLIHIKAELLSELRTELLEHRSSSIEQAKAEVKDELLSELKNESLKSEPVSGQLDLLKEAGEPRESKSELPGKEQKQVPVRTLKPPSLDGTLTTGELAKRFGIDNSSVSHWRPGGRREKSPEELLKITREKDPDSIGWIYLPDVKRFRSERDIPSEPPKVLKSDSLNTTESKS